MFKISIQLTLRLAIQEVRFSLVGWEHQQICTTNHYAHVTHIIQTTFTNALYKLFNYRKKKKNKTNTDYGTGYTVLISCVNYRKGSAP